MSLYCIQEDVKSSRFHHISLKIKTFFLGYLNQIESNQKYTQPTQQSSRELKPLGTQVRGGRREISGRRPSCPRHNLQSLIVQYHGNSSNSHKQMVQHRAVS